MYLQLLMGKQTKITDNDLLLMSFSLQPFKWKTTLKGRRKKTGPGLAKRLGMTRLHYVW